MVHLCRTLPVLGLFFAVAATAQVSDPPTYPGVSIPSVLTPGAVTADVPLYVEYDKRLRASEQLSALGSDLFGDQVSLYTGQTAFRHVDIDIPGNNALPVQLSRRYTISTLVDSQLFDARGGPGNPYGGMGNWNIEVPHIYGTFDSGYLWNLPLGATTQQPRCSEFWQPQAREGFEPTDIWSGNKVSIPGKGEKELLWLHPDYPPRQYPSDGRSPTWTTSDFDAFRCITLSKPQDEGFVMTTRDGVSYRFDVYIERDFPTVRIGKNGNPRKAVYLLASEVTDRYGNWVRYAYNGNGHPTSITASDDRAITLTYGASPHPGEPPDPNRLLTVSVSLSDPAETRIWTYTYAKQDPKEGPDQISRLTSVALPDNVSTWQFDYASLNTTDNNYLYVTYLPPKPSGKECLPPEISTPGGDFGLRITHPSGAKGDFLFELQRTDRSNLPKSNCKPMAGGGKYLVTPYIDAFRLTSKTIFDTDKSSSTWSYAYGALPDVPRSGTTISQPDGSFVQYQFSNAYGATKEDAPAGLAIEGQLLETTTFQGGAQLRTQTNTYVTGPDALNAPLAGYPFPSRYGVVSAGDDGSSGSVRPLLSTTITQQSVRFTRTHEAFDVLARPVEITRESTAVTGSVLLHTKTETMVYDDKRPIWVLDLVDTVTNPSLPSTPMVDTDYDGLGNPTRAVAFGREQGTMTWRSDGTLQSVTVDTNTTTLGTFKRGVPQSVTYADLTSSSALIDDAGDIRSVTDENGYTTTYGYDALRRLTSIGYPTGDPVEWHPTTIQYDRVGTEADIDGTHWRQTVSTGNARKIIHYDQRLRPRLTKEYDTANESGTQRYVRRGFDYAGRETFVGFPSTTDSSTDGTDTAYDALGRVTETAQASELGTLTTSTVYNPESFTTHITNARSKTTSTTYQVFDEPDMSAPLTMTEPLGVTTTLTRDVFGKPLTLTRSGKFGTTPVSVERRYVYDENQLLCKTIEPESGATVFSYNASNLIEWKASGQALTSTTNCERGDVVASQKVNYGYDPRDRRQQTTFGDGSPAITVTFEPDGLPETVQSDNSTWTTVYNKRRLMTSETLTLGASTYPLSYTHTQNGHVASLTYPDSVTIAYAPNALGEATQVGDYATAITRHPNGALKNLTYGNGIVHTTEQNIRGLPSRSLDVGVLDDEYIYDENANVTSITDALLATFTRTMVYDDRDRLTAATNAVLWDLQASFEYDPLDNLRRSINPVFGDWTYVYNATTQRLDHIQSTSEGTILTYGYDTRGRATARALTGTSQTFTVDLADRVNDVKQPVDGIPTVVAAYRYDGHGRRTSAAEEGIATVQVYSQAGQLTYQSSPRGDGIFRSRFQIGDTPYSASGDSNTRYVYLGRHLIAEDGTAGRKYIHTDGLGSPVRTTNASGVPSAREDYKPYGWDGPTRSAPGFTGHVADAKTGLIYMQARYYDPYAGRFLAVDPVGASTGSFNRYWYANNNPYTFIDPDGREGCAASRIGAVCAQHGWSNAKAAMGKDAMRQGAVAAEFVGGLSGAGGTLSSAYELVTGKSPLSGEEASRIWAAVGLIPYAKNLKYLGRVAGVANDAINGLGFTRKQLQHAFKHAKDFGIGGNASNKTLSEFSLAIQSHVDAAGTSAIQGMYRGIPVTHHVDPATGLNVIRDSTGNFLSGWKLNPQQLNHVLSTGKLGGGL